MKKRYIVVPAAAALLLGICAMDSGLPEGFDKNQIFHTAKDFLRELNRRDYRGCCRYFSADMLQANSPDRLAAVFDSIFDTLGAFVCFRGQSVSAQKSAEDDYVLCVVKCQYENNSADFSITFDRSMQISGLSVK
ncbi:MAG: DUF3887 domain-containing protein [Emergencia sp.]